MRRPRIERRSGSRFVVRVEPEIALNNPKVASGMTKVFISLRVNSQRVCTKYRTLLKNGAFPLIHQQVFNDLSMVQDILLLCFWRLKFDNSDRTIRQTYKHLILPSLLEGMCNIAVGMHHQSGVRG